jgi:hypothetical protein
MGRTALMLAKMMASGADGLNIAVMVRVVTEMMIVFVSTIRPEMAAVDAG